MDVPTSVTSSNVGKRATAFGLGGAFPGTANADVLDMPEFDSPKYNSKIGVMMVESPKTAVDGDDMMPNFSLKAP